MKMNHLFKNATLLFLAVFVGFAVSSCNEDEPVPEELSSEANISSFVFSELDPEVTATISGNEITATLPYDVDLTELTPAITISDKATIAPSSDVARDFSEPVTYTVTAEDGTENIYTVTVDQDEPPMLVVNPLWERTLASGGLPEWFSANNDRDLAVSSEYVFVHNNNDRLRVMFAADGSDVSAGAEGFINGKENFASGNLFLLGTATDNQGRIVASNLRQGSADEHPWNVYVWEDKDASQELLFQYPTPEGYRLGENLSVVGDVRGDAIVYVPGSGYGVSNNEILKFTITGGEVNTTPEIVVLEGIETLGNAPDVTPVSDAADANMIVAGTGISGIAEFDAAGNLVGRLDEALNDGETAVLFTFALDVAPFEIQGRKVVATTATDFTQNAADAGYLYLIDYTDGWENVTAANIERIALTPEGNIDTNFNGTGGIDVLVNGDEATIYAMLTNFGVGAYNVSFE